MGKTAILCALVTLGFSAGAVNVEPVPVGQWLQFRGDRALTDRSTIKGDVTRPGVQWKHSIGSRFTRLRLDVNGSMPSGADLPTPDTAADLNELNLGWNTYGLRMDLEGTGKFTSAQASNYCKTGKFLPDELGCQ